MTFGIFEFLKASLESAAPTNPTGTPTIALRFISPFSYKSIASKTAVGALPETTIPSKSFSLAYLMAAAALVI